MIIFITPMMFCNVLNLILWWLSNAKPEKPF